MRSTSEPPLVAPSTSGNLTDCVVDTATEDPGHVSFSRKLPDGRWEDVRADAFLAQVCGVAKGLIAAGVRPGDRVGIMSRTRYEWTVVDVAVWFAGAVGVPVYETSSPEQVQWILSDSGAVACVVETIENAACVAAVHDRLPQLRDVWTIDTGSLEELTLAGRDVPDTDLERARTSSGPGAPALGSLEAAGVDVWRDHDWTVATAGGA